MNFVTPVGFRDVMSDEALVRENLTFRVQRCFSAQGYLPIETPTLEVLEGMFQKLLLNSSIRMVIFWQCVPMSPCRLRACALRA